MGWSGVEGRSWVDGEEWDNENDNNEAGDMGEMY